MDLFALSETRTGHPPLLIKPGQHLANNAGLNQVLCPSFERDPMGMQIAKIPWFPEFSSVGIQVQASPQAETPRRRAPSIALLTMAYTAVIFGAGVDRGT